MSDAVGERLDLASKVDRDPRYLQALMADGERRAAAFLRDRPDPLAAIWDPLYPHRYQPRAGVGSRPD
jgi:hypothetical protein